jgi:hypothetical protein
MPEPDQADQSDSAGFELAVGFGFGIVGLIAAVVFGLLALTGAEIHTGFFYAFLFGYAFMCVGVTVVFQRLADRRLVSAIICGAAALLLAALMLLRRDEFEPVALLVGAFCVVSIAWWGYKAYRGHKTYGR